MAEAGADPNTEAAAEFSYRRFNAAEMLQLFAEVDEELQAVGAPPVRLEIAGGASMLLRRGSRVTGDVDVVSEGMNDLVRRAARLVADRHNLAPDWLNDGDKGLAVALPPDTQTVFSGSCLGIESVGPEYLLAMKLTAARPEDLADCVFLIAELGVYSHDELLDLIERALRPPRMPTAKMGYFAQEALAAALDAAAEHHTSTTGRSENSQQPDPPASLRPHAGRSGCLPAAAKRAQTSCVASQVASKDTPAPQTQTAAGRLKPAQNSPAAANGCHNPRGVAHDPKDIAEGADNRGDLNLPRQAPPVPQHR